MSGHGARRTQRRSSRRGRAGAIAAVDAALWDLKARVTGVALVDLLGPVRDGVDVYGSGGFTFYATGEVADQLAAWVDQGIARVTGPGRRSVGLSLAHPSKRDEQ